jgi:hypothetical protein
MAFVMRTGGHAVSSGAVRAALKRKRSADIVVSVKTQARIHLNWMDFECGADLQAHRRRRSSSGISAVGTTTASER